MKSWKQSIREFLKATWYGEVKKPKRKVYKRKEDIKIDTALAPTKLKLDKKHKIREHGAVFWVTKNKNICCECGKPIYAKKG